jgi:hypothetical protein
MTQSLRKLPLRMARSRPASRVTKPAAGSRSSAQTKVPVSPQWINNVSWPDSKVYVDLTRETIQNVLERIESLPVSREDEKRPYDYYARSPYWAPESEQPGSRAASKG